MYFLGFSLSLYTKVLFQSSHFSLKGKKEQYRTPFLGTTVRVGENPQGGDAQGQSQGLLVSFSSPEIFVCSVTCHSVFCFNDCGNYPFIVPQTLLLEAPSQLGC